jgi:hypothetical protein
VSLSFVYVKGCDQPARATSAVPLASDVFSVLMSDVTVKCRRLCGNPIEMQDEKLRDLPGRQGTNCEPRCHAHREEMQHLPSVTVTPSP